MKPLDPKILDHCREEAIRVRDILIKVADEATSDPLRKSSVLVTMLETLCIEFTICVGHDRSGCANAWSHITLDVAQILDDHFDKVEKGH